MDGVCFVFPCFVRSVTMPRDFSRPVSTITLTHLTCRVHGRRLVLLNVGGCESFWLPVFSHCVRTIHLSAGQTSFHTQFSSHDRRLVG